MDNATNNDTLVTHFATQCAVAGITFSEKNSRMRCLPHTIHLAALEVYLYLYMYVWWINLILSFSRDSVS
jgi:hypothetical protein